MPALGQGVKRIGDVFEKWNDIRLDIAHFEGTGFRPGQVEHLVDEAQQGLPVTGNHFEAFVYQLLGMCPELACYAQDDGKWSSKLVGNIGEEPVFKGIHLLKLRSFLLLERQARL